MKIEKVISGGQIGADIAGLRAAKKLGIPTGGYVPKGWRTLNGSNPALVDYGCIETNDAGYPFRTRLNVRNSDATLRFALDFDTPGEKLTMRCITEIQKPHISVPIEDFAEFYDCDERYYNEVSKLLKQPGIKIINIAGNAREEIEPFVEGFLTKVLSENLSD